MTSGLNSRIRETGYPSSRVVHVSQTEMKNTVKKKICDKLRSDYSPRHIPDRIYAVDAIPYTLTGKKMEVPVRKILLGIDERKAANRDAMSNPTALDFFVRFHAEQTEYSLASND